MLEPKRFYEIIEGFSSVAPILVVGDIGVDKYTKGQVNRISPEAPVPIVEVFEQWNKLGLAANVSDNLQSLDIATTLCGIIGNDTNGNVLESLLEDSNLSTWGIVRCPERMTTFKERVVTNTQQICRVDYETTKHLKEDTLKSVIHRISEFIEKHSSLIIEDYGKGLYCQSFAKQLIDLGKKHGKFISVDPSRGTDPMFYKGVNLLKPNKLECELMVTRLGYNETSIDKMAAILVEKLELEKLIITLGKDGMAILDTKGKGELRVIPTVAREVFDVSGAGDTAISTIVASLACGASLDEAAFIGNCASGVVVAKKGTALVTSLELKEFYEEVRTR
jgi:rfaE bifunctional protein kinase chain/domain